MKRHTESFSNHGKPWQPQKELRDIFEHLVLWYTVEDIAHIMGRTTAAVSRKMNLMKIPVFFRRTHKGGVAKRWSAEERAILFAKCRRMTQSEVANFLGTSRAAVEGKWRQENVRWDQGYIRLSDLARIAGCSVQYVSRVAQRVFPQNSPTAGKGSGRRWRMTLEQAKEIMTEVRPGRVPYLDDFVGKIKR